MMPRDYVLPPDAQARMRMLVKGETEHRELSEKDYIRPRRRFDRDQSTECGGEPPEDDIVEPMSASDELQRQKPR